MAQKIDVPGMGVVEFPDGMTDAQITSAIKANMPSAGSNLTDAAAEIGKVADQTVRGAAFALPNVTRAVAKAAQEHSADLAASENPFDQVQSLTPMSLTLRASHAVGEPDWLRKAYEAISTPTKPTTELGKAAGNIGETVVGTMIGPGALKTNLKIGAGAGIGGEVAARATDDNPLSRMAGSLVGGGIPALVESLIPNATKLLKQATSKIPEADWRRAKVTEQTLKDNGIAHLKSQLLGERSTLADLMSVAGMHPAVRPDVMATVSNAPEQSRRAYEIWKNSNLPIGIDERAGVLADVQGTAAQRITDLKAGRNKAYTAALPPGVSSETYGPPQVASLVNALQTAAKDPAKLGPLTSGGNFLEKLSDNIAELGTRTSPILGQNGKPLVVPQPVAKGYINNAIKDLNVRAEKEGFKQLPLDDAKGALRDATPEFQPARDAWRRENEKVVGPAQRGLVGQLAQMGGGVKIDKTTATARAMDIVFPADAAQPQAIRELSKHIGGQGVGELLRENLSRNMEKAVKLTSEAGKAQQPFNFVQAIAGTNAQRQNLEAALEVSAKSAGASPAAVRNGFYKLMRAFETTKDLKLPSSVDRAALQQQAGLNIPGMLVAPNSRAGRFLWERSTEKTFKQIADIVMAPDGLKKLEQIAKSRDPSVIGSYATSVLTAAQAGDVEQETP